MIQRSGAIVKVFDGERPWGRSGPAGAHRAGGDGAPTHEIMAQGRWKSAGMVADDTRAENAAQWLG